MRLDPNRSANYAVQMQNKNKTASLLFDRSEAFRYMILENRFISHQADKTMTTTGLMRRIDLGEVSFMSTDLDPLKL